MPKPKIYEVKLSEAERNHLKNIISSGTEKARKLTRARILLKANEGWYDKEIVKAVDVSRPTVEKTRKRFALEGFEIALNGYKPGKAPEKKIDGKTEAYLIALTCNTPPAGRAKWTLRLLAEELVALEQVELDTVSYETVRQTLKKRTQAMAE